MNRPRSNRTIYMLWHAVNCQKILSISFFLPSIHVYIYKTQTPTERVKHIQAILYVSRQPF